MGRMTREGRYAIGASPLGTLLVAVRPEGLCAVMFGELAPPLARELARRFPTLAWRPVPPDTEPCFETVRRLIATPGEPFEGPLALAGTPFQRRVWDTLRAIPSGTTLSYGGVAAAIGQPKAARAVASACAANPVAVVVPCHRVVHQDGSLGGFGWGVARKAALLAREGALDEEGRLRPEAWPRVAPRGQAPPGTISPP